MSLLKQALRAIVYSGLIALWLFGILLAWDAQQRLEYTEKINVAQGAYLMGVAQCKQDTRS